jgi:PhnB protein
MAVKPIPDNYPRVIPYLIVKDVQKQMDFLIDVFGAKQSEKMTLPDGTVNHAEVRIGDSVIMMGRSSNDYPPIPAMIYIYVEDTDAAYNIALKNGAKSIMEPADQFYGDRNAGVSDPYGNSWWMASHVEDVSTEEIERRNKERAKQK